jgi:hypothetical protein
LIVLEQDAQVACSLFALSMDDRRRTVDQVLRSDKFVRSRIS